MLLVHYENKLITHNLKQLTRKLKLNVNVNFLNLAHVKHTDLVTVIGQSLLIVSVNVNKL